MIDRRSCAHNFREVLKLKPEKIKALTGFEPMTSMTPVQFSTNRKLSSQLEVGYVVS